MAKDVCSIRLISIVYRNFGLKRPTIPRWMMCIGQMIVWSHIINRPDQWFGLGTVIMASDFIDDCRQFVLDRHLFGGIYQSMSFTGVLTCKVVAGRFSLIIIDNPRFERCFPISRRSDFSKLFAIILLMSREILRMMCACYLLVLIIQYSREALCGAIHRSQFPLHQPFISWHLY